MSYALSIAPAAERIFKKLAKEVQREIIKTAQVLTIDPLKGKQLKGKQRYLRSLHFTYKGIPYRIIYQLSNKEKEIVIRLATTRENIYRKLDEMKIIN